MAQPTPIPAAAPFERPLSVFPRGGDGGLGGVAVEGPDMLPEAAPADAAVVESVLSPLVEALAVPEGTLVEPAGAVFALELVVGVLLVVGMAPVMMLEGVLSTNTLTTPDGSIEG